ncbi:Ger(x)C family spore germination protein [Bacillus pseudomycoides]|uniref:Ger(X)C family spore germination protein n=1 Tax=Bacillus bingmayongensis TaxID=1150157 RepID=A0ABU5JWJ6_9BACI|nr:Ger(x)C family spore germination protein [Bacillus pseudomycoides]
MIRRGIWIMICCIYLIGCSQRIPLEKATLILLIALDRTSNGEMMVGTSIPLFHHEKQRNTVEYLVKASSVYNGFSKISTKLTGYVTSSKAEVILIGKKFAQKENWMKELDSSSRDPYSTLNAKVVLVDGSIEQIFNIKRPDKPPLPTYVNDVIESSIQNNESVSSTIQQLIREKNEQGMTQTVPIIKRKNNEIDTIGIAFLDHQGKYVTEFSKKDVGFFNLINNNKNKGRMILHLFLDPLQDKQQPNVSVLVQGAKRKINVDYHKEKFVFNIDIYMNVALIEKINEKLIKHSNKHKQEVIKLEDAMKQKLDKELMSMFCHMQKNEIDPIGLSLYARAYQYKEWKKVKENWPHVLSEAQIHVNTHIKIHNTGTTRE